MAIAPVQTRKKYYVHKYEVSQQYGGPEEGGWWYDLEVPVEDWISPSFDFEEKAHEFARWCNEQEYKRQEEENKYGYTSVLSYREEFFAFGVSTDAIAEMSPKTRPHYE